MLDLNLSQSLVSPQHTSSLSKNQLQPILLLPWADNFEQIPEQPLDSILEVAITPDHVLLVS